MAEATTYRHSRPPPPPAYPISSFRSAHLENTAFPSRNNTNQLVDNSIPAPPRSHFRTASESTASQHSNPFRTPNHTPHLLEASSIAISSPVSPIEEEEDPLQPRVAPALRSRISPPTTNNMSAPRKSVDLRQLDGKPYPGHAAETDPKPRQVKVAQDMFPGEMPPGYDRQDYNGPLASKAGHSSDCHKRGGHKKDPSVAAPPVVAAAQRTPPAAPQPQQPQPAQHGDCAKCGGMKARSLPPSSFPTAAMANAQPRPQPAPRLHPTIDSVAGPSSAPNGHRHKCGRCGRHKRPESVSSVGSPSQPQPIQNFGATYQHRSIPSLQTNGIPVDITIEPPSAITERAPTLPFSPASVSERPLIEPQQRIEPQQARKLSRGNSISSLFRSLSKRGTSSRKSSSERQATSQNLVNGRNQSSNNNSPQLQPQDDIQRSTSPFSFVSKTQEDQAFEMNDMGRSKSNEGSNKTPERRNSWDKADESTLFLEPERPKVQRSQSTLHSPGSTSLGGIDDLYLGVNPDSRPGVTRFKSLRVGVNRAANGLSRSASQISRSTSLRRLESVKKVPQFWYREDMTIEGANGAEYVVNVY